MYLELTPDARPHLMSSFSWPAFWRGTTAFQAKEPLPTAVVNIIENFLYANAHNSSLSLGWVVELFWILLVASVPIVFFQAYRQKKHLAATKAKAKDSRTAASLAGLWLTPSWMVFFGLCDLYILGILPVGPWKGKSDKSLRAWSEKRYLRRLVHMGIVPLYIQNGGLETRQEQTLEISDESPRTTLPKYVQSKRRAYFEFLVPMARGYSTPEYKWKDSRTRPFKQFVQALLANHHDYVVTVSSSYPDIAFDYSYPPSYQKRPLEIGASSWLKTLLPFKSDGILQPAKDQVVQAISEFVRPNVSPLLETHKCPLVRVEVPDFRKKRLDEWIYGVAQKSGLGEVWKEGALHAHASDWIVENNLELPEHLIPVKDRL